MLCLHRVLLDRLGSLRNTLLHRLGSFNDGVTHVRRILHHLVLVVGRVLLGPLHDDVCPLTQSFGRIRDHLLEIVVGVHTLVQTRICARVADTQTVSRRIWLLLALRIRPLSSQIEALFVSEVSIVAHL